MKKTAIEELIKKKFDEYGIMYGDFYIDDSYTGVMDCINEVFNEILTKEKQEREELIEKAFIAGAECGEMFNNENRCFKTDANKYYNEVIKPKYKL